MKVYPLDKGIGYSLLDDIDDVSKTEEQLGKSKLLIMTPQNLLKENFLKLFQKLKKRKQIWYSLIYPSDWIPPTLCGTLKGT